MHMSHIRLKAKFIKEAAPPRRKAPRKTYSIASLLSSRGLAKKAGRDGAEEWPARAG